MKTNYLVPAMLLSMIVFGCRQRAQQPTSKPASTAQNVVEPAPPPKAKRATTVLRSDYGRASHKRSTPQRTRSKPPARTEEIEVALDRIASLLRDGMSQGDVLVVWFLDCTANAESHRRAATEAISQHYQTFAAEALEGAATDQLQTALVEIGGTNRIVIDEPTRDFGEVLSALESLENSNEDSEQTFAAIGEAAKRYAQIRRSGTEVSFVIVTNEAGDDRDQLEAALSQAKRLAIPVYVVGPPAPFGREQVGISAPQSNDVFGPESVTSEHIQLGFFEPQPGVELLDSGFGPFHLTRLAEASGGAYLIARPTPARKFSLRMASSQWPNPSARQFDPKKMRRYRPSYVSAASYRASLQTNAVRAALHEAAKLPPIRFSTPLTRQFQPKNQADLIRRLTDAQKVPARLARPLRELHALLQRGEEARDDLREPRWQAGFDLAFGRACAAKARVDGYNEMLATLKRESEFQNPESTRWILKPGDTSAMSSGIDKLANKATKYLERVVAEHPGTPWAVLAEEELRTPNGWKWDEE